MGNKGKIGGYRRAFRKYGIDARALQWTSREAQEKRLKVLVSEINFEGRSILDVGCGFGDIVPFIKAKTKDFDYSGVDLVPEFIETSRKKHPSYEFVITDYFEKPMAKKFDIVLSSGTLNANIKDPYRYRFNAIKVMFDHAKEVLAFNMAGGDPQPENKKFFRVYYADLNRVVEFCKTLSDKIKVRNDYSANDFTVFLSISK